MFPDRPCPPHNSLVEYQSQQGATRPLQLSGLMNSFPSLAPHAASHAPLMLVTRREAIIHSLHYKDPLSTTRVNFTTVQPAGACLVPRDTATVEPKLLRTARHNEETSPGQF
ncbi:hypothetical protein O3P69_016108 [Scylla paramamosain]|uniref:Uncharacterized protein n=1 Tax=Scylla paramamosain TaxID=85552 RepID=A0AAW0TBS5_SCYPA